MSPEPKLFGGFMSGHQVTEWIDNRMTNSATEFSVTGLSWIYGGEPISLKAGFKGNETNDAIRFLNQLVAEMHPQVSVG